MKTREAFAKLGVEVQWAKQRVVLHVGRERNKIVCSPPAFRWLDKLVRWALEAGFNQEQLMGVIRGSGCAIQSKREKREPAYQRAESRLDLQPIEDDCEPGPQPDPPFDPRIDDEFRYGTVIIDGVGFYPREDEGRPGRRVAANHRRSSR